MKRIKPLCCGIFFCATALAAGEVNLYTDRQAKLIEPILAVFTADSGIKVNVLFAKKGLLERMTAEGENSPADVVMAVDAGRMQDFADAGLLSPYDDASLVAQLDDSLYTPDWFAVTRRARLLFTAKDSAVADYSDLATLQNSKGVCVRTGFHPYNIALFADLISRNGAAATGQWLRGVKSNLARPPQGNDRAQIQGVIDGVCEVAIANSYYYFLMLNNPEKRDAVQANIRVVVPPQPHINITGVGLATHAPNRENAMALLRFLSGKKAQALYAQRNNEYPARNDVALTEALKTVPLAGGGKLSPFAPYRRQASELAEKVSFDN